MLKIYHECIEKTTGVFHLYQSAWQTRNCHYGRENERGNRPVSDIVIERTQKRWSLEVSPRLQYTRTIVRFSKQGVLLIDFDSRKAKCTQPVPDCRKYHIIALPKHKGTAVFHCGASHLMIFGVQGKPAQLTLTEQCTLPCIHRSEDTCPLPFHHRL